MNVLDRKLLRDLIQSKWVLLAVAAIIAVGTGCLVGMLSTYDDLETARDDYYTCSRMADFWVSLKKAPLSAVQELGNIPGIDAIRARISFPVIVDLAGVDRPVSGLSISMPDTPGNIINNIIIRSGTYFTADRRNEVIISEKFAAARELVPGDFIHMTMNGLQEKMCVVGTAISSEHIYIAPPGSMTAAPGDYGIFYIKRSFAEDTFGFQATCNDVVGLLSRDRKHDSSLVLEELNLALDPYGVFAVTPRSQQFSNMALSAEMGGLQTIATVLPIIFLAVAALVLNVLMTRMAEQQRMTVGTLKALGYRNGELFIHYLKFGFSVGLVGGIGGCTLGWWITGSMIGLYQGFFEFPRLISHVPLSLIAIAILISVAFAILGALQGVKKIVDLDPAEAMHNAMPAIGGKIFLERWQGFWNRLDFWWQMVLRGMFRNRARTLIAMVAALLGSSMVLTAFGLTNSMNYMVDFQFNKVLLGDFILTFREATDSGATKEASSLPGVTRAEPVLNVAGTFSRANHHKKGVITGLIRHAKLNVPCDSTGNPVRVPPTGLLMTERLAQQLDVAQGETITFVPVRRVKTPLELEVAATVESMIGLSVYADYNYLNSLVGEEAAVNELQLKARQTTTQAAGFFQYLKESPLIESLTDMEQTKTAIKKQMTGAMQGMTVIMIIFAGVIFFGSILNGSLISIAERRREIATFRVLGYRPREIGGMFIRENMLVNLTGAVLGLPVGYWMLQGLMTQFSNDAYSMPCFVSGTSWIWTIILALVFVLISHIFVQKAINRLNWAEALAMKE